MKVFYIVFIASDYKIGKMIRRVTGSRYNHVALSDRSDLSRMFSFARKHNSTPLAGGFVCEKPERYTKKPDSDPQVKVCRVTAEDAEYSEMLARFRAVRDDRKVKYNFLSAITYPRGRAVKVRGAFTCVEFVQHVLGIDGFVSLEELERRYSDDTLYEGGFRGIAVSDGTEDDYYAYRSQLIAAARFIADFITVCVRACGRTREMRHS